MPKAEFLIKLVIICDDFKNSSQHGQNTVEKIIPAKIRVTLVMRTKN